MKLVEPSRDYLASFQEAMLEPDPNDPTADGQKLLAQLATDFDGYWQRERQGQPGRVPMQTFWLVDEQTYLGCIRYRNQLTEALRQEGGHIGYEVRPSARGKGYGKVMLQLLVQYLAMQPDAPAQCLLTCDEDNTASQKVMEAAGAVFERSAHLSDGDIKRYYWLTIRASYA